MSVIFDSLDNIQTLRFKFTQAIKLGASLYYIDNQNLKRLIVSDNQLTQFTDQEAINVMQNVSQICSDGKIIYSLQTNGDLYQIDQQPKLLVSGKNYTTITPTTAIDHSGRGFNWKNQKVIYSHCKHISTFKDKMTLITIGGKIFNIENENQVPIQQLNGLGVNGYFKKSILFQFGGIAITENGDAYCYTNKMIKLKISNLEDISTSNRFIYAVQGKYLLQWNLEDFQNHQFYVNQTLFKKMNYGHEIQINCKKKEFQDIKFIFSDPYSSFCCAQLKLAQKVNQIDQSVSCLERTFCRSSVSNLKQQLFDQWDPPNKKKGLEQQRQGRLMRGDKTERSDTSNKMTDRYERKEDLSQLSQESRFRSPNNNNILDALFEKPKAQQENTEKGQENKALTIDTNFNYKCNTKSKSEFSLPLEITKLPLTEKPSQQQVQVQQVQCIQIQKEQQPQLEKQKSTPTESEQKQPSKLLEQYKKQFDSQLNQNSDQIIDQSTDNSKEQEDSKSKPVNQEVIQQQQNTITQKLQSIREIYDQPRFKTQNNSLYTLDEESSVEQSMCQEEEETGKVDQRRQGFLVNEQDSQSDFKQIQKKLDQIKQKYSSEQTIQQPQQQPIQIQVVLPEIQLPPVSSSLNNFLKKFQHKPEKSIDSVLQQQDKKEDLDITPTLIIPEKIFEQEKDVSQLPRQIKSFLKADQISNSKKKQTVEVMEQQSVIDYQNNSDFIDQQHDSFMQILQTEKKPEVNKIQNIMQMFDTISISSQKKKSPPRINLFKKQDQENQKKVEFISEPEGQLDENLSEIRLVLVEKQNTLVEEKKVASPNKSNMKEHKTLVTFSEDISSEQATEDRIQQAPKNYENKQSILPKPSPIRQKSPEPEVKEPLIKLHPIQMSEKSLTKVSCHAEVRQLTFEQKPIDTKSQSSDQKVMELKQVVCEVKPLEVKQQVELKSSNNINEQKQALSRIKIQPLNCAAIRPEKNFTPLRSRRNSTARATSIDGNRFKQLQIDPQVMAPECQNQTPQINTFEPLDLSNAMYHIDQTILEDTTKRTPVAQVIDIMTLNQQSNQKIKEPTLIKVSAAAAIPPSLRTNSIGPVSRKTEVSPIKSLSNLANKQSRENDTASKMKKRQQDIILRKLFFRLDIHLKLAKLEFMFNLKQKIGK